MCFSPSKIQSFKEALVEFKVYKSCKFLYTVKIELVALKIQCVEFKKILFNVCNRVNISV